MFVTNQVKNNYIYNNKYVKFIYYIGFVFLKMGKRIYCIFVLMKIIRLILLPLSLLYGLIVYIRNFFYDKNIFKSTSFNLPVIAVGNLSTGGTGKSPQIEYLINLLNNKYAVATLSRGYKRKSKGFILADDKSNADILGDEPYQFYTKFTDITVAVDADRVNGIKNLLEFYPKPDVVLLDDAYQHRKVKAGFYILLTAYGDLYADDFILPAGNLREGRAGARRSDVIIVTKCPPNLTQEEQQIIKQKLKPEQNQEVYFTFIDYDTFAYSSSGKINIKELNKQDKLLVAGIAKPEPFFNYLKGDNDICKTYPDHHYFSDREIDELEKLSESRIIVTTEKDYMRLKGKLPKEKLFYLPIRSSFINNEDSFTKTILNYVGKSTGNR